MTAGAPDKPLNLDYLAATHAQRVISETKDVQKSSDVENAVTKALGVLQENGVYACFVFALSRVKEKPDGDGKGQKDESKIMKAIVIQMLALLNTLGYKVDAPSNTTKLDPQIILEQVSNNVTKELNHLLLAKEVLEQMLIYARYGAKARPDTDKATSAASDTKEGATA